MKKNILTLVMACTIAIGANAGIQISVKPWGRDAEGYPLYIDQACNIYYANGEYMGHMSVDKNYYVIVTSPNGKVFKFANPFNGPL